MFKKLQKQKIKKLLQIHFTLFYLTFPSLLSRRRRLAPGGILWRSPPNWSWTHSSAGNTSHRSRPLDPWLKVFLQVTAFAGPGQFMIHHYYLKYKGRKNITWLPDFCNWPRTQKYLISREAPSTLIYKNALLEGGPDSPSNSTRTIA